MRDHRTHREASRHEAVEALMSAWSFTRRTTTVRVDKACGRIAAQTVRAQVTLPNTRISNMDAIAVRFDGFADGMPDVTYWKQGEQWQFCNTGVAMPDGFDTAIRIEDVQLDDDGKLAGLSSVPKERFASTSPEGCRVQEGDVLVRAGEEVTPLLASVLCMGGVTRLEVVERPRVAFVPTGNELVRPSKNVPRGKNIESNGVMACAKLEQWGAEPTLCDIVPDDRTLLRTALKDAAAAFDIVVINAGSSKGSDDWTCEILEEEGRVLFHEVSQGPGRHCSFSMLDGTPVVGISGPPVGAEFSLDFFVKPFVDLYLGASLDWPPAVTAIMLDRLDMQPRPVSVVKRAVVRRNRFDQFVAWCLDNNERPLLRGCAEANGLVVVDKDSYGWAEKDRVLVELRYPYAVPARLECGISYHCHNCPHPCWDHPLYGQL